MRAYLSIMSARYRTLIQYRAAAFAGFATQLFWGFIRLMILTAFYESSAASQPMSFEAVVAYVWLGQAFLGLMAWNVDKDVVEMMRSGAVAYELLRPLRMYRLWFIRAMAWRTATASLRSVPLLLVAGVLLPLLGLREFALPPPAGVAHALSFVASLCATVMLTSALTTIFNITLFWTVSGSGVGMLFPAVVMIFSGLIIPLPLLPDWAQPILRILPFRGLADVPFRIYSGNIDLAAVPLELLMQVGWALAFILLGSMLIGRGMRRVTIQGG